MLFSLCYLNTIIIIIIITIYYYWNHSATSYSAPQSVLPTQSLGLQGILPRGLCPEIDVTEVSAPKMSRLQGVLPRGLCPEIDVTEVSAPKMSRLQGVLPRDSVPKCQSLQRSYRYLRVVHDIIISAGRPAWHLMRLGVNPGYFPLEKTHFRGVESSDSNPRSKRAGSPRFCTSSLREGTERRLPRSSNRTRQALIVFRPGYWKMTPKATFI